MTGSLDELIQFLLGEIALSGQRGSKPADILGFVSRFYQSTNENVAPNELVQARRYDKPTVDRAFQEQVWRWLTKHPDVLVGRDGKGNKMSLSAVEAQYRNVQTPVTLEATKDICNLNTPPDLNVQQHHIPLDTVRPQPTKGKDALRVYVTEERMWLAICGHPKDLTKVFETEFVLLSIIAAHRELGILQGDLVKESGQDKRSVPKRTDSLRNKGYIEKRAVHLKGLKTSRLVLRRFASNVAHNSVTPQPVSPGTHKSVRDECLETRALITNLFTILKEKNIVTRDDLKRELNMSTRWQARALGKITRRLEVIGCLRRVKAASEASKKVGYYFDCVKLIHEPSEQDLKTFDTSGPGITDEHAVEEPDLENEDDAFQTMAGQMPGKLEEVGRILPQWNPDRPLSNCLLNVVQQAGTQGYTNRDLRHHLMGIFFRRPLENLLTRLTATWLQSQPSHLRHLAILRDTMLSGTIPLYVQYSFPNFEARVASGHAFWEAVREPTSDSGKKGKKKATFNTSINSNSPELDTFGFPANHALTSQFKGARATLGQCLLAAHPGDLPIANRDPVLDRNSSGTNVIRYDAAETSVILVRSNREKAPVTGSASPSSRPQDTTNQPLQQRQPGAKPRGRPRKFLRGTEKFWQGQFAMVKAQKTPDNHENLDSRAGMMSDPAGLALFAKRPPQFDAVLVRALQGGLPVPAMPKDIAQEWVDKTLQVLDRTAAGVYVTPKGVRFRGTKKYRGASRLLVVRSSRLGELDLSKKKDIPAVRFLISSAAHTFVDLQNGVVGGSLDDSDDNTLRSSPSLVRGKNPARGLEPGSNGIQDRLHEPLPHTLAPGSITTPLGQKADEGAASSKNSLQNRPSRKPRTVTFNEALLHKDTPLSHNRAGPENMVWQASPTPPSGLPPPLTTRSLLRRRQSDSQQTASEISEASAAGAVDKSDDQVGALLDSINPPGLPSASTQVDQVLNLEDTEKIEVRSEKPATFMISLNGSSLNGITNIQATRHSVLAAHGPIPNRLESGSQSLRPSVEFHAPPLGIIANHEKYDASATRRKDADTPVIEERDSEAFRLVQELLAEGDDQIDPPNQDTLNGENQSGVSADASSQIGGQITLPEMRISDPDSDHGPPQKRRKQEGVGAGSIAVLRRKIMIDLMEACSGALPYYQSPLCSAFTTAWQKAGQSGKPDLRTIKAVVKSLCQNGSAKQIKFSHRNKKGAVVTKTILAKADMAISHPNILETQRRMIEADPHPYLPDALRDDLDLNREMHREPSAVWPAVYDEQTVEPSETPAKVLRLQLRETLSLARKRQRNKDPEVQDANEGHDPQGRDIVPRTRLVGIRRKYTTASAPYKRPKLSVSHNTRSPQRPLPDQLSHTPNPLQFRTENPEKPLTFDAFALPAPRPFKSRTNALSHSSEDANFASQASSIATTPQSESTQLTNIIWKEIGVQPVLPSSVQEILLDDRRRKKPNYTKEKDPNYREFEWNIDGVTLWEQRSLKLFDSKSTDWVFINHFVGNSFQSASGSSSSLVFTGLIWYDTQGREHTETRFHVHDQDVSSLPPENRSAVSPRWAQNLTQAQLELPTPRPLRKRKRDPAEVVEAAKRRRRKPTTVTQPQTITDSAGNVIDVSHLIGAKYKRPRGTQHLRTMPKHFVYKLTVTIVVVRALAGGLEKHVDWPLVMCVFPDEEEQFLKDRWKTLSNKHRRDVDQLIENFQDKFPEAYAKGEVPQINLDEPESIDWKTVVEWALNSLDKPVMHEIPDLPATMSELNETVNMKIEASHRPYRDLLAYNTAVTVPTKEVAISAIPFAVPLPLSPPKSPGKPPHLFDPTDDTSDYASKLAKSWALSTVATPLETFDPAKAHDKLHSLAPTVKESEKLVDSALKSLAASRAVVKKRDKSVDPKGRSFDLSRVFNDILDQRRTITATMLKQALRYKTTVLDPAFRKVQRVKFHPVFIEDGDMIAILNLTANGRIKITIGDDVPRNRWGVDPTLRYQTRKIKKENLYFTVMMEHIPEKYVFGNPLLERDAGIPDLGTGARDMIPIWRDIHGNFQHQYWDLAIAAVLGIVATRSGASVREVAKTMNPSLAMWEVECLLEWCWRVGAVKKTGEEEGGWTGGWEVREWWWLVLGCGRVENSPEQVPGSSKM
ncbi:hypothetical protein EPUS_08607 [Endocarpon pusillum Z07020]|uniref:Uncharacterized protein n=1 Tax=Endocarpon pusillum (strain Z07020 / HMAS-L-300199) TaxID=1263415 RepID=U1GLE0_ENDPU|nr:uncharacterized protein EPUS_08607 [Endocarpon pusillum Z07020]ERF73043.1 hypothetical protein EPUS_08607 [Endocarpon pusillum Z07020]